MGGYIFLSEDGEPLWQLNLGGAIVWHGLLEEMHGNDLRVALLEVHNWGEVWDGARYRELARTCIRTLASNRRMPPLTDEYRASRGASVSQFRTDALRIFRGSLQKLPATGRFIAADDLNMDWLEEPCECESCKTTPRPNPRMLSQGYANRSSPAPRG